MFLHPVEQAFQNLPQLVNCCHIDRRLHQRDNAHSLTIKKNSKPVFGILDKKPSPGSVFAKCAAWPRLPLQRRRPPALWFAKVASGDIVHQVGTYLKPILGNPQVEDGEHDGRVAARRAHDSRELSDLHQT